MTVASIHIPSLDKPMKLGRKAPDPTKKTLKFKSYFAMNLMTSPPPPAVDYSAKAMASLSKVYLNDQFGDCVIAGKHHQIGVWTGNDSPDGTALATDQEVYQQYQSICGPGDNGCVITHVLDVFQQRGLTASGKVHTIDGYVAIDWTNKLEVQVAIFLFGALTIGINLPSAWANAASPGAIWDVTRSGIVGGHDVTIVGYNSTGVQISTWGMVLTITWQAFLQRTWVEECYALLSPDWYGSDKLAPCGVAADKLAADLAALKQGQIPDPGPGPTPVVPPSPPVPPTPVPSTWPIYQITGSVQQPAWFGGAKIVPFTGQALPISPHGPFRLELASGPVRKVNIIALVVALNQLRKDLQGGDIAGTMKVIQSMIAHAKARDWTAVQADLNALEAQVGKANWTAIVTDLGKVFLALGIPLPF